MGALAGNLSGERLAVRSYGAIDGLPGERVHHITQDSRGFLWFSTADGLTTAQARGPRLSPAEYDHPTRHPLRTHHHG